MADYLGLDFLAYWTPVGALAASSSELSGSLGRRHYEKWRSPPAERLHLIIIMERRELPTTYPLPYRGVGCDRLKS